MMLTTAGLTTLYVRAAGLHLRLSSFFDNPTATDYRQGLSLLYVSATTFLEASLGVETAVGSMLNYCSNYIYQMTMAAGFVLLKLYKSFFSANIDVEYTKILFSRTIWGLRTMSVSANDLPARMTEVLARMWKTGMPAAPAPGTGGGEVDGSLQLKVKCRMSMSLVYDSVWRWREDFLAQGNNLERMFPPLLGVV